MVAERPALQRYVGRKLTVIAWLWARTVKSPNPVFAHVDVPLASTFMLSTKKGKEAYVEPVVEDGGYRFTVKDGAPEPGVSKAGVTETGASEAGDTEAGIRRNDAPESGVPEDGVPGNAGVPPLSSSFPRKWESMRPENGVSREDTGVPPAFPRDDLPFRDGGTGATAYAEAIGVYSGLALSRFADRNNALCTWDTGPTGTRASTGGSARTASLRNLFARQAIPMAWGYGEANPFSDSGGGYSSALGWIEPAVRSLMGLTPGAAEADSAPSQTTSQGKAISTDPPYYDNIAYADLSDFFYVWLRRSLRSTFPELFSTLAVSKAEELVAIPYRHGSKDEAETFYRYDGRVLHGAHSAHEGPVRVHRGPSPCAVNSTPASPRYAAHRRR